MSQFYIPYFRRKQEERGEIPSIWNYDDIPVNVKTQIILELNSFNWIDFLCYLVINFLRKEFGRFQLAPRDLNSEINDELFNFFVSNFHIDESLTVIEIICMHLQLHDYDNYGNSRVQGKKIIEKINFRLRQGGIGYAYNLDSQSILKVADEPIHQEAIEPAFHFLNTKGYELAKKEFKEAFDCFRGMNFEDAVLHCGKSIESTIKTLLDDKKIPYDKDKDNLGKLIDKVLNNDILPNSNPNFLPGLKQTFTELTKQRNSGGHGASAQTHIPVDEAHAKLALNLGATFITFLSEVK